MHRSVFLPALALMSLSPFASPARSAEERPVVAVFDVACGPRVKLARAALDGMAEYISSRLTESGRYQVVPRDQLRRRLVQEKKGSYKDCFDQTCQIEVGKELAAEKTLATRIVRLGRKCTLSLTLYDLRKSTTEVASTQHGGCGEDQVVASLDGALEKLVGHTGSSPQPAAGLTGPRNEPAGITWVRSAPAGVELTKSEVTVAQYQACVQAGKCSPPDSGAGCNWGQPSRDQDPINCVDWHQATAFCAWAEGRLPTEEELIAELSDNGRRKFPWGDEGASCVRAIWNQAGRGCGRGGTWPVCSKPAGFSVSGLCDLAGNLWEWTSSAQSYGYAVRGGSWFDDNPDFLSPAGRFVNSATDRTSHIGFRCGRGRGSVEVDRSTE